jgi:formamidopyrimidine-DNA glycosylase
MARLHPLQQVFRIPRVSRGELIRCIHRVLLASLREGGTTLRDYRDVNADRGKFARRLAVYGKAGRRCRRCGATLRGMFVVQRSTVICPVCQRLRRKGANAD